MAETLKTSRKTEQKLTEAVPTLFIGLGGTGAEVLWRIRRNILSSAWYDESGLPFELESLEEFPLAQFLQIDPNHHNDYQLDRRRSKDPLVEKLLFKEHEMLIKGLDLQNYIKTDDYLARDPIIQEWFPFTRSDLIELATHPSPGAGQIRAFSRLYFFEKYAEIKKTIRTKADSLLANLSSDKGPNRLGISQTGNLRIVVVASTAGGTGSGMFLDMGYLSSIIGKQVASGYAATDLALLLPTGYKGSNHTRSKANTYAALMELETSMRPDSDYIKGRSEYEIIRSMPDRPYDDVYLIDATNIAGAQTNDLKDIYDMVADSLFLDISMTEFSAGKRSISVNQRQHKVSTYFSRVPLETYGDIKLTFSRCYSSFGQVALDFRHEGQVRINAEQGSRILLALDQIPERTQLFVDLLRRAMPWVDAKLDKYLGDNRSANQYRCFIGVKDSMDFKVRYGAELRSLVPTATMMTAMEITFLEIDTPGRLVCYVELSGFPLPSLKAIDDWYFAYHKECSRIPLHTNRQTSAFVHPREFTMDELASRAEDLKLFVEAVALGVLTRSEKGENAGLFKLRVNGGTRNVGYEKLLRMEGFHASYRKTIQQQVELDLEEIKTDNQMALWVALMEYYLASVYPLALRQDNAGYEQEQKSLPTFLCERLVNEWTGRLQSKSGGENQAKLLLRMSRDALSDWTDEIPGSIADVYQYEVNFREIQPKRALKRGVLQAGWSLGGVKPVVPADALQPGPIHGIAYYVAVNGQQTGPHNSAMLQQLVASGHLMLQTKVWRQGLVGWLDASLLPELSSLFAPPPLDVDAPAPLT